MASDDKQLSGMVVCEVAVVVARCGDGWQFAPCGRPLPCEMHTLPRPASPTPEQPAQDGGNRCKHGIRAPWECKDCLYGEPSGSALAPPAQTQQGLSDGARADQLECALREIMACVNEDSTRGLDAAMRMAEEALDLKPRLDKQPSPSAAPAQEPEHCPHDYPIGAIEPVYSAEHDNYYCPLCKKGMGNAYYRAARERDKLRAASPEGALREALRYARDHITGSGPLWRTQSEVIDIIDSALHDPIGTYRCPVCDKDTPHHHHASIGQAAVAREDDQKAPAGGCAGGSGGVG